MNTHEGHTATCLCCTRLHLEGPDGYCDTCESSGAVFCGAGYFTFHGDTMGHDQWRPKKGTIPISPYWGDAHNLFDMAANCPDFMPKEKRS